MELKRSQSGIALFVVLGVMFIMGTLFFFLMLHSREYLQTSHSTLVDRQVIQTANALANVYWIHLREVCQNRSGCTKLYPANPSQSPLYPFNKAKLEALVVEPDDIQTGTDMKQAFQEIFALVPGFSKPTASARFRVLKASANAILGEVQVLAGLTFQKKDYTFIFPREFKLVRCLAPVVSKFTLFVRDCSNPHFFNSITKGFQDERGSGDVLTLFNTPKPFVSTKRDIWQESGWVYIGGPKTVLHLDGSHPCRKQSDNFIFWPGLYLNTLSQDLPYACSANLGTTKLRVRFTPIGAMKDWQENAILQAALGTEMVANLDKSSCLRLFGNRDHITPTRVFGNVSADYVLYATMILDTNGDAIPDRITSAFGVKQRAIFPLPRLRIPNLFLPPIIPRSVTTKGFDLFLDGAGMTGVPNSLSDIFPAYSAGTPSDYVTFMTKLASDFTTASGMSAYNSLYDQIFENSTTGGTKTFPAPHILTANDYPNNGQNFNIPTDWVSNVNQFTGNLAGFDPGDFFEDREIFSAWYDDQSQFLGEGILNTRNGISVLDDPITAYVGGELKLPRPLRANAPMILVSERNLTIKDVKPSSTGSCVVLVSLHGNIIVEGNELSGVCLVAPNGKVEWNSPLKLSGTMCAKNLSTACLEKGGSITYDPLMDLTSPAAVQKSVVLLLGPNIAHTLKDSR